MTRYAALLQGVNVGGRTSVPMADLRELLGELGHTGVATYLRSGNAVFTSDHGDEDTLAAGIAQALEARFGRSVACLVRDAAHLAQVAANCPFPAAELEGRQLHVTFYDRPVEPARFASVDPAAHLPEEFRLGDRALYLYVPDGLGRSKLAAALSRPAVTRGLVATSRNWNTVEALVGMTRD
ncbi:DUF1697 domain-containing protein [uncultured Streptomyces sp.]|uniref:DUF1697 domain-containing protein n=1 Tax=uncultured Streptomyces sp. TaxID=174707 RepID=UPI00261D3E21|nr:DUF1697 domain-containing protein [uncultured Streptomyces sp.]